MRTYNILFRMPKDHELQIAAWAAVSTYETKLREMKLPFQTCLLIEESWLTNLIIPSMVFISSQLKDFDGIHFDLVVDLKDEDAIDLGKMSGRTAANCFGAMFGLTNVKELISLQSKTPAFDLLIIPWNSKALELAEKINTLKNINITISPVHSAKAVCGYRSPITYLEACKNKPILELYTIDEYPKEFLSKYSNPRYSMLCGETKESIDNNLHIVYRALEKMISAL